MDSWFVFFSFRCHVTEEDPIHIQGRVHIPAHVRVQDQLDHFRNQIHTLGRLCMSKIDHTKSVGKILMTVLTSSHLIGKFDKIL